jgi:hypothetical protein
MLFIVMVSSGLVLLGISVAYFILAVVKRHRGFIARWPSGRRFSRFGSTALSAGMFAFAVALLTGCSVIGELTLLSAGGVLLCAYFYDHRQRPPSPSPPQLPPDHIVPRL